MEWSIDAFGKHFDFDLQPNDRILAKLPKTQREKIAENYELFRGKIEGNEESWIRLTKIGEQWSGMIWDGHELYIIDTMKVISPALRTTPLQEQFEQGIYRLSDTRTLDHAACGVEGTDEVHSKPLSEFRALSEELQETFSAPALGATLNIDIAIVTDPLFAQIQQNNFGTPTDAAVIARLNVVDGIYSEQVGVQLNLVEIVELTDNGPLTSTDSATLLSQFGNFTSSSSFTHPGVAHLFTGRDIDGNTIGRAYVGSLCSDRFGVGINEIRQGGTIGAILFAHELGHNFGAPHDNQSGSACASTPGNFIMNPVINNSDEFSQCSLQQMQPEVNSASCITVIDSTRTDIRVILPPSPFEAPMSSPFDYDVEIENTGTIAANNVNATLTVSGGLEILDAATDDTSCSIIGTTQADCVLGDIPAGEDLTITLSLRGQNPGQAILDAEITADNDQNALNNTAQGILNLTNTDPIVTILSPPNGAILSASNPVTLVGEASDLEDGELTGQLEWTSDLDGPLGNGGNLTPTLSLGTHRITAMVEDSDDSQGSQVIVITIAEGLDGPILFESHFDGGTDGFGYADDTFRNTNEPAFADGAHEPDQGFSGGGLRVTLGGINEDNIRDMSGGWSRSLNLDTAGEVTLSLRYKLTQTSEYESDELSQALLAMDGTLVGTGNNDYLAQLAGDGNGGNPQTTDWVPVVVNFGTLPAGLHTLVVGAYNNKKTWNNESTEVLIDDIVVHHTASGPPPSSNGPNVSITSPTDGDSFTNGATIGFAGQAQDDEDGPLTSAIVWTSDQDGPIGSGGSFSSTLSIGNHRITASVTDSDGNTTMNSITISVTPGSGNTILFESHFDSGPDGFGYADDTFRNTTEPAYADGTHEPALGFSGGGLRVALAGLDTENIRDMSGGWSRSFTLNTSGEVTVSLRYHLTLSADYDSDELSQVLLAVNGTLVGSNGNEYLAQLVGDGNGGSPQSTGWVSVEVNLGALPAGTHTLTLGGYNNKKTWINEMTEVLLDDVVVRTTPSSPPPPSGETILFESHFDSGPDGFGYADDTFRNTTEPAYADGTHEPALGFSDGGLRVALAGLDTENIRDMSGGWSRSFTLNTAGEVTVSLRYNLTLSADYDSDELSQVLLAVNGTLVGSDGNDYLAQLVGDGNGGSPQSTGWVSVEVNLGALPAGTHTLTLGGFNNKKTWINEMTEVLLDDVVVRTTASTPPPPSGGSVLLESHFDSGPDGFGYADDTFRNTTEPAYADGSHEPAQGFTGGGLRVTLGGLNEDNIRDMSGGWSRSFTLDTAGEVTVSLRYNLTLSADYDSDELSQVLLAMNGTLVGSDGNEYLAQLVGDGNGGNPQSTGWVSVEVNLGMLPAGTHTLALGGFNNKKTWINEMTEVLLDDVVVRHTATGQPLTNVF